MALVNQILADWVRGDPSTQSASFDAKYELHLLLSAFIRGSKNPLCTALRMARRIKGASESMPEIEQETRELCVECQLLAIKVLESIKSSRCKILALEIHDGVDIAVESELHVFMSCNTMKNLRQAMWTCSSVQILPLADTERFVDSGSELVTWWLTLFSNYLDVICLRTSLIYLLELVFKTKHQYHWFFSPIGKYQLEMISYLVYAVILLISINNQEYNVFREDWSWTEIWFWIANWSFVYASIRKIAIFGWEMYAANPLNPVDLWTNVCFAVLFVCRLLGGHIYTGTLGIECSQSDDDNDTPCTNHGLNLIALVIYIVLVFCVVIRISMLGTVFRTMGYVVQTLLKTLTNVSNFFIMLLLWLGGFGICQFMCVYGVADEYGNILQAIRSTFYAMMGDFEWSAISTDIEDDVGVTRSYISHILFIFWLVTGTLLFANFIVTIMGAAQSEAEEEIQQYVDYKRLHVTRLSDRKPPTIPPPFQLPLIICKTLWYTIFEPLLWLFCGRFINEEYFICKFDHWKGNKEDRKFYQNKKKTKYFKKPLFIKHKEYIRGKKSLPSSKDICGRIKLFRRAYLEMWTGKFYENADLRAIARYNRNSNNSTSSSIVWICNFCCTTNIGFKQSSRRKHLYNDIYRYHQFNDNLPPEYGFMDTDLQWLDHINPTLCDNCFRNKYIVNRHLVIEAIISFYMYNFLSFLVFRLPFGIVFIPLLSIIVLLLSIYDLIRFRLPEFFDTMICCCCSNSSDDDDTDISKNGSDTTGNRKGAHSLNRLRSAGETFVNAAGNLMNIRSGASKNTRKKFENEFIDIWKKKKENSNDFKINRTKMYSTRQYGVRFELEESPIRGKQYTALLVLLDKASDFAGLTQYPPFYKLKINQLYQSLKNRKDWAFSTDDFIDGM